MTLSLAWQILYWGWVASEIYIAFATRTKRGGGQLRDRGSQVILWVVIILALTGCGFAGGLLPADLPGSAHAINVAALLLLVLGLVIRWTAILTLGRAFSANVAIREQQKIRKTGLYRFLRHPSYLGMLLIFLAAGLHSRNWIGLAAAFLPTTAAVLYRIHVEEIALHEAFGDEYVAYSKTTKRLLPGVY